MSDTKPGLNPDLANLHEMARASLPVVFEGIQPRHPWAIPFVRDLKS